MRFRRMLMRGTIVVAMLAGGLTLTTVQPAGAAVVMTVTPDGPLNGTTALSVAVTGLAPNQPVGLAQCPADRSFCIGDFVRADANGSLAGAALATVILGGYGTFFSPPAVDCRTSQCVIVLVDSVAGITLATWPVVFAVGASASLAPVTLTPPSALTDGQLVTLNVPVGHLWPGWTVSYGQCASQLSPGCSLDTMRTVVAGRDGSINVILPVSSSMTPPGAPGPVDCQPSACSIIVSHYALGQILSVPIEFAPGPLPAAGFRPTPPTRLLDSRTAVGGWAGPLRAGLPKSLQVANFRPPIVVPPSASSVVLNVTVTNSSTDSHLKVWPSGASEPVASNLNFAAGQTIANLVTVRIGGGGVQLATAQGSTDVVVDVVGYYDFIVSGSTWYNGIAPTRALDSRTALGGWGGPLIAGTPRPLKVTGIGSVPRGAPSVIVNITATNGTDGSYLSAGGTGSTPATGSMLNFGPGQTVPNLAILPIVSDDIWIANAIGSVDVIVDVVGYFDRAAGSKYHALPAATRILDDRVDKGLSGPFNALQSRTLNIGGDNGIPMSATGVVMNTTVTGATEDSLVTAYPTGISIPGTSNLNFAAGQTVPNLVISGLSSGGQLDLRNHLGGVDIIGDVAGYFSPT